MALGKTVEQLLEEISSEELTEWKAYQKLEPFGSMIENYQRANIAAILYNSNVTKKGKLVSTEHYMLGDSGHLIGKPKKQSTSQMKKILMAMNPIRRKKRKK